jgi:hypothetical protein
MPRWKRAARAEEIGNGHFEFLNTGVVYGDDGIKGLRHFAPLAQSDWVHDGTANHAMSDQLDAATSRLMKRITAAAGGAITSYMRKQVLVPRDFWKFPAFGFAMIVRGSGTLPTAVTMTVKRLGTADANVNDLNIKPSVGTTFESKTTSITSTTYLAGDVILLEFKVTTANAAEYAEIGAVQLGYTTARGNV